MLSTNNYEELNSQISSAMKSGDKVRLETIKQLKAALVKYEKDVKAHTEESELKILMNLVKSHKESIEQFNAAGRVDLANKETAELNILKEFMPEEVTDEQVSEFTKQVIENYKQEKGSDYSLSMKDMGNIKKLVNQKYPTANGKIIQETLKSMI